MSVPLSPAKLRQARRSYNIFNIFNSFSFVIVSGSFLTLYAMSLGASKAMIGVLNALAYSTFFFLALGKRLLKTKPIVWVFGWGWVARYVALSPVLFAPVFASAGQRGIAIGLVLAGAAGFSLFRGIAMISNNPVLDYLASGGGDTARADRGAYMVSISVIASISSMVAGFCVALILGENAGPAVFSGALAVGIIIGLMGCVYLFKSPEPRGYNAQDSASPSLRSVARDAFKDPAFTRFIEIFMILAFVGGMGRSFLPVYAKDAFGQGDDAIMLYSLISSLGSVAVGLIMRLVVDRLGSKPLFIIYSGVALLSMIPVAILAPGKVSALLSPASIAILLAAIHFASSFGFAGEESSGQTYYFSLVPKEKTIDLAVIYYFAYGLGGALGSGLGGVILDILGKLGFSSQHGYRILYALLSLVLIYTIIRMRGLKKLGSRSVVQSLGVMFSPRDLRAFDLLARLDQSVNPQEEVRLIHKLGESASALSQSELSSYLHSPRLEVRMEALLALENMPVLDPRPVRLLIKDMETNIFTTAYISARILGRHAQLEALGALRNALNAPDYMLQGAATSALASMQDRDSIPDIEALLSTSSNPRVRISAAIALEQMQSLQSLPALVACLRFDDPPAFVSDEVVLAIASLLGMLQALYPMYSTYIDNETQGIALLKAAAADILTDAATHAAWEKATAAMFAENSPDGSLLSAMVLRMDLQPAAELVLADAVMDPVLGYKGLRFLVAAYPVLQPRKNSKPGLTQTAA